MTSLARQLVEHPRWRWEPGMHLVGGYIVNRPVLIESDGYHELQCYDTQAHDEAWITEGDLRAEVDLDDPATKGWLLAMLREATGLSCLVRKADSVPGKGGAWFAQALGNGTVDVAGRGHTEGEALARALLAAWGES